MIHDSPSIRADSNRYPGSAVFKILTDSQVFMTNPKADSSSEARRFFIQPLAVAVTCAVFIGLFLASGMMNIKILDQTIKSFMRYKAEAIVSEFNQTAEWYYAGVRNPGMSAYGGNIQTSGSGTSVSLQESFLFNLMNLAGKFSESEELLGEAGLRKLIGQEGIHNLILTDSGGRMTFSGHPVNDKLYRLVAPFISGNNRSVIRIFDLLSANSRFGFMAMPRPSKKGTVIMVLDNASFKYRCAAFAVQKAADHISLDGDTDYMTVYGEKGLILVSIGSPPNETDSKALQSVSPNADSRKDTPAGRKSIEIGIPAEIGDYRFGMVYVGFTGGVRNQLMGKNRTAILIAIISMTVIAGVSMWLLFRNQNKHLAEIENMEKRVYQAERLSALGGLAAGVAHEIRNPLNAVSMGIQRLRRETRNPLTGVIQDEIRRLNQIIDEFISIARTRDLIFKPLDLRVPVEQIVVLMNEEAQSRDVRIDTSIPDRPVMANVDVDKIKQALLNLIRNALDAVSTGGWVTVSIETGNGGTINLKVADTGKGISSDDIDRIFDPDYTTKEKGLGLGLPLAYEIIKGHGGEIRVSSVPGAGSAFECRLPVFRPENRQ